MYKQVIIDGNNLLYAMHEHAPRPAHGQNTLIQVLRDWAKEHIKHVYLVFDGSPGRGSPKKFHRGPLLEVRFSAPKTADDVIIEFVHEVKDPGGTLVVSTDTAIKYEAKRHRCGSVDSEKFIEELFPEDHSGKQPAEPPKPEKPKLHAPEETDAWLRAFGYDPAEMKHDPTVPDRPSETKPRTLTSDTTADWDIIFGVDQEQIEREERLRPYGNENLMIEETADDAADGDHIEFGNETVDVAGDESIELGGDDNTDDDLASSDEGALDAGLPPLHSQEETDEWLRFFGFDEEQDDSPDQT